MSKILGIEDIFEKADKIAFKIKVYLKRKKSNRQFFDKPNKIPNKPKQKRGTTERFNRGVRVGG